MKSRFTLTANKAAPRSDRMLVFAPVLSAAESEREFVGASKPGTVSILADTALAQSLEKGEYFIEITPAAQA
jgi:hypothetical protein